MEQTLLAHQKLHFLHQTRPLETPVFMHGEERGLPFWEVGTGPRRRRVLLSTQLFDMIAVPVHSMYCFTIFETNPLYGPFCSRDIE